MSHIAQAGAIAVRREGSKSLVLIARAKKNPLEWIFPKGHIEPGETASETAIRELQEEAGVSGEIVRPIGVSIFASPRGEVEVTYFLVRSAAEQPSPEGREKRWTSFRDARRLVTFPDAPRLLSAAEHATRELGL
jgi:diadenosine hexaphosphate hydrolase (ATP-forming)